MWCMNLVCLTLSITFIKCEGVATAAESGCVPHGAVESSTGWACVCNSSYCDVIAPPTSLPRGQFHVYSTSKARPGFTHTTGTFGPVTYGPRNQDDVIITVNSSLRYQKILGFGGAMTDTTGIMFNLLPKGAQDKFIESYFGINGTEYTFIRVPIGSSDFSPREYTLNGVPYDVDMKNFNLTRESYLYQIPIIKRAQSVSRHGLKLLATSWLVPAWMKMNVNESNDNIEGWFNPKYYNSLTEYHARFIEAYKSEGLDMWALSMGNQPVIYLVYSHLKVRHNLTFMTADTHRDLLRIIRPRIDKKVKLCTLEDSRIFLNYWMDRMQLDEQALKEIDGIGLHWYTDNLAPPTVLDEFHTKFPEKLILYTESSINPAFSDIPVILGSWDRAEYYIQNIIENINHWTNVYMDWNMALNTMGGPSLLSFLDAPVLINETSGEFYKQPMFYAMGHFSKFIQPGAERIGLQLQSNQKVETRSRYPEEILRQAKDLDELTKILLSTAPPVAPVVMALAVDNPDGSRTVIVFNPKNTSVRATVEDIQVGNMSTIVEEKAINSFTYWPF